MKKDNEITIRSSAAEYLTYVAATGSNGDSIEMRYEDENIWLTQKMMATLYDVSVSAINQHLKKIFADSELSEDAVIKKYLITAGDGKSYNTNHYNLQAIIAVGFKVNNERAIQFRKWANAIVKDYTIQGWVMDDERLKNGGSVLTEKYFEHLLERIREIRISERKFYQKITDIYATALDYDKSSKTTKQFFANVQNKLHWADRLNRFLEFNEHEILTDSGRVTHEIAKAFAESEFEKYRIIQDRLYESDFDKFMSLEQKVKAEDE